ncbi:MAG: hypothetical protein ACOX6X_04680 [Dethiobacteria bacterium]|jgi:hypothetical protein
MFYISQTSPIWKPENLKIVLKNLKFDETLPTFGPYNNIDEAFEARDKLLKEKLDEWYEKEEGITHFWVLTPFGEKMEAPDFVEKYGYIAYDPYPESNVPRYWRIAPAPPPEEEEKQEEEK